MAQLNYETHVPSLFEAMTPENIALLEEEGRGPLTSNIPEAGAFFRTRAGLRAPDIQFHYAPSMLYDEGLVPPHDNGICFGPLGAKPKARGKVFLRSHLPDAKPRVLHNFLTEEDDRASMIAGIRMALEIARQAPLAELLRTPYRVPASDSDADILAFIQTNAMTVFHPTSSCAIGAVVDSDLRVKGVEGLRVVDASVMPSITRGNTNAPTIMIAEKAADLIAGKRPAGAVTALA